jgi:peptidoglycan/LPS O-acetylase OafA/YrhL
MNQCLKDTPAGRIRELDGWRAVAASMVVFSHIFGHQHARTVEHFRWLFPVIYSSAYLGVQIFFVISGFVICRLLLREEARSGSFSLKAFYIRRVFRILPPFYLYLGVIALLGVLGVVQTSGWQIAKAALFLTDFHSLSASWLTGHAWSLAVEEQFYLFFPAILLLSPLRWRSAVCGAICASCIAWTLAIPFTGGTIPLVSAGVMDGFVCIFCGVLIGIHEQSARALARRVPVVLVLLAAVMLLLDPFGHLHGWKDALYQTVAVPPAIGLVLLSTMERKSWFRSVLCSRPVQATGITSYALYLWQELFTGRREVYFGVGRFIPFLVPLLCVIVPLSWFLIEKPAMRLGRNLSRRVRRTPKTLTAIVRMRA